ncbi:hypothetical protein ACEPAI_7184 [Sanghuangporus weigelae]
MPTPSSLSSERGFRVKEASAHEACRDRVCGGPQMHEFVALVSSGPETSTVAHSEYERREDEPIGIRPDAYNDDPDPFACALYSPPHRRRSHSSATSCVHHSRSRPPPLPAAWVLLAPLTSKPANLSVNAKNAS